MLAALLLSVSLSAFSGSRAYAAGSAPAAGPERAGVQVQDDDGNDDGDHHDGNDNDSSHDANGNDSSHNDVNGNDSSRQNTPTRSQNSQPSSSPSRSSSTPSVGQQGVQAATVQTFTGAINYKPRNLQGIWVIGFKAFFVDSNTDLGAELASAKRGDTVDILYFVDAHGLGRAVAVAGQ